MRKPKKSIALLLAISLCASMLASLPLYADTISNTAQADALKAATLFVGTNSGYNLPGILTRAQGITLALRAQGMEAAVQVQTDVEVAITLGKVADSDKIPGWARKPIAFALKQTPAITTGVSKLADGRVIFAPDQEMSGKQFVTFMVRAMGYDSTLDSSLDAAVMSAMLSATQVVNYAAVSKMTRGQAVDIIYSAVKNGIMSGTGTKLVDKLVQTGAITTISAIGLGYAAPIVTPIPTPIPVTVPLAVSGVAAINCKQVQITFNREVNPDSIVAANFELKDKGITLKSATPVLAEDKKTVLLTLDGILSLTNASAASITVKKSIRDAAGSNLGTDYVKSDLTVFDVKLPEIVSISAVGSKAILISYDESVWNGSSLSIAPANFTVKSGIYSYSVLSAVSNPVGKSILLTLGGPMIAGTIYVKSNANGIGTGSVSDFAGYSALPRELSFTYSKDSSPVTASVQSVNRVTRKITVKFSKPIYGANVRLYQLISGIDAYGSIPLTKAEADASSTWEFTMPTGIPAGTINFFLVNSTTASEKLSDLFDQKVPDLNFTYTIIADVTPPSVILMNVNGNTSIDVIFNEEIDPTEADKIANFEIKNSSGVKQVIVDAQLQADQQTVRLLVPLVDLATYTIKVVSMKDLAGNAMTSSYSASKLISDSSNPKVTAAYAVTAERKIYITFSEAMNTAELGMKTNYLVDRDGGTNNFQLLGDADSVVVTDNRHIVLTMGLAISFPSVKMAAMHDLSGKKLGSDALFEYTGEAGNLLNIGTEVVSLEKAELIDYNVMQMTFNTRISALGGNDFLFRNDADGNAFTSSIGIVGIISSNENASGQSEVVVLLDKNLNSDATYTDNGVVKSVEIQVQPIGTISASYVLISARNHASALTLLDGMGGAMVKDGSGNPVITWNDFNGDAKLDTVVVKYDEAILESSLSTMSFTVAGYSVSGVSIDSDGLVTTGFAGDHIVTSRYVVLNITKAGQTNDAGTKPAVTQVYAISDRLGNVIE
jgi:hypothetical protein